MHEMRSRIRVESIRKCRAYDFEDPRISRFSVISSSNTCLICCLCNNNNKNTENLCNRNANLIKTSTMKTFVQRYLFEINSS